MKTTKLLLLMTCFFLISCSKPKFTCKPGLGVNCKSMHEIHLAVKEDRLDQLIAETNDTKRNKRKSTSTSFCLDCSAQEKTTKKKVKSSSLNKRKDYLMSSTGDDVVKNHLLRIWIAPFISEEGYSISEHYIEMRN